MACAKGLASWVRIKSTPCASAITSAASDIGPLSSILTPASARRKLLRDTQTNTGKPNYAFNRANPASTAKEVSG